MSRSVWFSLEGNIGAGKSTVIEAVRRMCASDPLHEWDVDKGGARGLLLLQEPVDAWNRPQPLLGGNSMLQAFYASPQRHAFAFQMYVLLSRIRQAALAWLQDPAVVVTERCINTDCDIFTMSQAALGRISMEECLAYLSWKGFVAGNQSVRMMPDVVVYMRTRPETCLARVQARGRSGEEDIDLAYLQHLHAAHEAWVGQVQERGDTRVVIVDADGDGQAAAEAVAAAVVGCMRQQAVRASGARPIDKTAAAAEAAGRLPSPPQRRRGSPCASPPSPVLFAPRSL